MGFLDTITSTDLKVLDTKAEPRKFEEPVWDQGETVDFVVTGVTELNNPDKQPAIIVNGKALNTGLKGKVKGFYLPEDRSNWPDWKQKAAMELLTTVLGRAEVEAGTAKLSDSVGVTLQAVAGNANDYKGKTYQDFFRFKKTGKVDLGTEATEGSNEIPF